jgi:hypothetical protein
MVCSCKFNTAFTGWFHDVLGFFDFSMHLQEGVEGNPVGVATATFVTDTIHTPGITVASTQATRQVNGETHRFALFYNHTNDTLYLAFDNGLGVLEQVTGGTIAATQAADPIGGATGYRFSEGMRYFGMATFEFTTPPADWFTAVDWMTKQWSVGNKALYPGWRS